MQVGKLPVEFLDKLLKKYANSKDKRIIVGPRIGVDATVIDFYKKYIVLKTDPITFTADHIGYYSVVINSNDIACMGGIPRWYLGTLLLPAGITRKEVEKIFKDIKISCDKFKITLSGGHVEITHGIEKPILIGFMLGEVEKDKFITSSNARVNDNLILTKGIAIEGISVIASEKENELTKVFGIKKVKKLKNFIYNPGISVLKEALLAKNVGINAMHDLTEGGLATGLYELAFSSKKGMLIYYDKIKFFDECLLLCKKYNINPLGLIASGALLITASPSSTEKLIKIYNKHKIPYSIIGKIMPKKYGIKLMKNGKLNNLPEFKRDEITKIF